MALLSDAAQESDADKPYHIHPQGECGHQCQPDDPRPVPGSPQVEPAAQGC